MSVDGYSELDATGMAALVRGGEVTPRELALEAIRRIEAADGEVGAVVHRSFERALAQADDPALPDGPFRGVPLLMKDLGGMMAGEPMHAGSAAFRDLGVVAPADGHPARRLLDAGFVVLGRTNTAELGLTFTTEPAAFGPTRNPWDPGRSAGGSSGGSAAAVAAGYLPAAHAGDGGGSVRVPASMTGLVGLKASRGRISIGPDVDEAFAGMATEGFLCRTVRDAAGLLDVMAGYMPGDPYVAPPPARPFRSELDAEPGRLRVGVLPAMASFATDPSCSAAAEGCGALLEGLGHDVEAAWPAALDRYEDVVYPFFYGIVSASTAAQVDGLEAALGTTIDLDAFEPLARDHIKRGRTMSASEYLGARVAVHGWARELVGWWVQDGWDLLVTPTIAREPFALGELAFAAENAHGSHRCIIEASPYTPAFNMSGQPAISLPLHETADGLPVGVQLVAAPGREDVLLRVAAQVERAAPWADRRSPLANAW